MSCTNKHISSLNNNHIHLSRSQNLKLYPFMHGVGLVQELSHTGLPYVECLSAIVLFIKSMWCLLHWKEAFRVYIISIMLSYSVLSSKREATWTIHTPVCREKIVYVCMYIIYSYIQSSFILPILLSVQSNFLSF